MKYPAFLILLLFVSLVCNIANGERIKRLSGTPKPRLTAAQIRELEKTKSEKHTVEGYVSVKSVVDCFDEMSYRYTGGRYQDQEIKFRLRFPNVIKPGKKYPLIVWFHGKGESDDDNERQLAHMQCTMEYLAGSKNLDFFLLATQCPKDNPYWNTSISSEGKGDAPITIAREIMETLVEEFPIDKNRITVFGLSSGGSAAWKFVSDTPEQFAGLVTCSAVPVYEKPVTEMNIWVFANTEDGGVPIDQVKLSINKINAVEGTALLTALDSTSHDSWTCALGEKKVFAWLVSQHRNSTTSPPPGAVITPKTWFQAFIYYGLPVCCMVPFLLPFRWRRK